MVASTLQEAVEQVLAAQSARDLFAEGDKSAERYLPRCCIPIATPMGPTSEATGAFTRFQELLALSVSRRHHRHPGRHTDVLGQVQFKGSVANLYRASA